MTKLINKRSIKNSSNHNDKSSVLRKSGSKNTFLKKSTIILRDNIAHRGTFVLDGIEEEINEVDEEKNKEKARIKEKFLNEDMPPRIILISNPQSSKFTISYNYGQRKMEKTQSLNQLIMHFEHDGNIISKESDEYKCQEIILEKREKKIQEIKKNHKGENEINSNLARKIIRNKFNYTKRQTQNIKDSIKERGVSTAKPKLESFCGVVTQHWIYDTYIEDLKKKGKIIQNKTNFTQKSIYSNSFKKNLKIMERMIIQNDEEEKYNEYKYKYTNKDSDLRKMNDKKISNLWRFIYAGCKKSHVTCISWNKKYPDWFASGYGSYDFGKKKNTGTICLFSIKNIKYPELIIQTNDSVMSLDFHPKKPALLAVGLYNGTVLVYDVRNKSKNPIYYSTVKSKKHTDPVWQIYWDPDTSKSINFFSISSDGRVMNWILMKDKLEPEEIMKLKLINKKDKGKGGDEETSLISLANGLCFDFNKFDNFSFIVGTEEGNIHKCSKAYSGQYQETYHGHQLAVYKVKWSPFHKDIFLSASADWSIKIWNANKKYPFMSFELSTSWVDIVWSPFNSSVFIGLSLEKNYIYDLSIDRNNRIEDHKPVRSKCTNLAFNPQKPILLIGDSHGGIASFKWCKSICDTNIDLTNPEVLQKEKEKLEKCLLLGKMFDEEDYN